MSGAGDTAPTAASSQTGVASVEYSGVGGAGSYVYEITANGAGSATISFTSGNTTAHMAVTVESGGSGTPAYTSARATTAVNLRGGPGTEYEILTTLATGTVVTVLSTGNPEWTQVRTASGLTGYLSTEYIQFLKREKPPAPAWWRFRTRPARCRRGRPSSSRPRRRLRAA